MEIFDDFCWEDHKKVIPGEKHKIPGLGNFAYWNLSKASPPTPEHHHSDIVEIHCLIKGKRVMELDGKEFTVTGNELFITFPFENHSSSNFHLSPCSFYGFQINVKNSNNLLGLNEEYSLALYETLMDLQHRHLRFSPMDQQLLKQAFKNISDGDPGSLRLGVQYLSCFLFQIPDFHPVRQEEKKIMDTNIKRVMEHIEKEYLESILLQELAVISGYSLSRFKIKFKEEVGITPANYITLKKLEFAKKLLRTTDKSITSIALDAGFSSSNYFCTVLKKLTNYSPNEFRENCRANREKSRPGGE